MTLGFWVPGSPRVCEVCAGFCPNIRLTPTSQPSLTLTSTIWQALQSIDLNALSVSHVVLLMGPIKFD